MPGLSVAVDNTEASYAGSAGGDWSGGGSNVPGLPDGACANMGAVDKANTAYNFGFSIPGGATITALRAKIFAGASDGQDVNMQLFTNPSDPPTTIGDVKVLSVAAVGSGNCQSSVVNSTGGDITTFWGLGSLTPATVNDSNFGILFTKIATSQVKVDSICMEIDYTTAEGDATQESCFETITYCGDGVVQTPNTVGFFEECDDGNQVNTDSCTNACTTAACGDGYVQAGEQCDDGPGGSSTCSSNCKIITPSTVVPTMTEWGMIIFIILAGIGSIYYLRRQRRTR